MTGLEEKLNALSRMRWKFSIAMTILLLVVYFGFILIIAFNKSILATLITGNVPVAIPIGLGIILFSWLLTGYYVRWANKVYDNEVEKIKREL